MEGEGDAREEDNIINTIRALNRSCDRCGVKKRKCDGGNPCLRCIRLGETCGYSKRRARPIKPKPPRPVPGGAASDPTTDAPATLQAGRGVSAALRQHGRGGRVSLKRCRLSPSPATGLVGMRENAFLSDYFGCVGFLPFTSQSKIRETMVKMFAGLVSVQQSDSGDYSTTEQHVDTIIPADSQLPVDPSTCVFWCAVALGSLVKGRPIESVEKYSRLARDALANVSGPPNAEVARAWAILAYMSDFCGDHDKFNVYLQRANAILWDVQEEGNENLPEGLSDVVKHGETIKLFVGELDREEVKSFCYQEQANPQMSQAATEGDICQFVMRSYRSFEQALYQSVVEHRPIADRLGGEDDPSADNASADPVGADLLSGSRPHFFASVMREGVDLRSSGILDIMTMMTRKHSHQFQRIEHAADWLRTTGCLILPLQSTCDMCSAGGNHLENRPSIRGGVGGLIINGTLVFEKIAKKDIGGALDNLENCGEVMQRYPGICRFTMWSHVTHMLMAYLVLIDGPRARGIYEQMRPAYNSTLRPGAQPIPPFEEWQGVSSYCDNYNCRLTEFMVSLEYKGASSSPPPQERAAEMQEKGSRDVPVESQQQRGVPSATGSQEGTEGNPVVVTRPTDEATDASRSNREPEVASDEESLGCMESMSSESETRSQEPTQSQEPTFTSSPFREVVSEPMVDSDVGRIVNEQSSSSSCTELGGQAAEALLSSEFGKRRAVIGETEDDSIGVEDWLDVTHAMLDTSGPGLDLYS